MEPYAILVSSFLVLLILRHLGRIYSSVAGKLPPGPVPEPLVGSLFKLGEEPQISLAELAAQYGPVMSLRLGRVTTVVVSSPAAAREVLQKKDRTFAGRSVMDAARVFGHDEVSMVWLQPGPLWRSLRALCKTCVFSPQRLDATYGLRRRKLEEMLAHVGSRASSRTAVDVGKVAFVTTLNLVSNTLFSADAVHIDSQAAAQEFKDVVTAISESTGKPNLADFFPILRLLDPQGTRRKMGSYMKKLLKIFEKQIEDRESARAAPGYQTKSDFLDALLDQIQSGAQISRTEIKSLFADLFVAGSDTSADTVEWAMAELLRNPGAMARARTGLRDTIGAGNVVEESDVPRLPYLRAVVKESLRLHPVAPLLPHRAECDGDISGYPVPKHTRVVVNVWAMGRDGGVWDETGSFRPERFLESGVDYGGQHFEFIPFGSGRRMCPGMPLAIRMVHLMLASLLHSFDWELPAGTKAEDLDMRGKFGLTLRMAVPLVAVPING